MRPANPASVRLCVEAAIQRVVILRLAQRAHGELRHRGLRPVIRNAPRDREARSAVGAVEKGIAIAPVRGIKQLSQAIQARRRIRRNAGTDLALSPGWRQSGTPSRPRHPSRAPQPNRSAPAAESPRASVRETSPLPLAGPSISMVTPSVSLPMNPAKPSSWASR